MEKVAQVLLLKMILSASFFLAVNYCTVCRRVSRDTKFFAKKGKLPRNAVGYVHAKEHQGTTNTTTSKKEKDN